MSIPAKTCRALASASGLRQVFPEQTKRIFFKPALPNPLHPRPAAAVREATCEVAWNCVLSGAGNDTNNELTLQRNPTN